jgi:two-component system, cell cycle sensor histidine kinase and response regulator CckA
MSSIDAAALPNQIASAPMRDREALKIEALHLDPLTAADGFGGYLSTIFVVAAAGAVVFGLISSGSGEPLLLTVISVLAMLGMFLLFGIAAGHVRIGARLPAGDILKAAADGLDDPQMVTSADGGVLYWNPSFDKMFGRSESGPRAALEGAVSGDPDAAQALFRLMRAAERGEARREDIRLRSTPAGTRPTWIRVAVRPFASPERAATDKNGQTPAQDSLALWQVSDVSSDKAREAQKIGSLEAALASFDSMPAGFMSISADGSITHVNTAFESWLGHEPGKLRTRALKLSDVAGDDGAGLLESLATETDAERRAIDLDLTRSDGRIAALTLFVEPSAVSGEGGFTVMAILRSARGSTGGGGHQEIRFSQFFQSAPFGIATLDAEGRIASCNTAFMRMVLDGRPAHDILATSALCRNAEPDERSRIDAGLAEVLTGRGNVQPIEITGGENKQFSRRVYLSPVSITSGSEAAALYVVDVTEQKALESRFAQAQKMEAVGNLAGGIAHDFNNVLTAIIGFSDLLLQTHRPSDPAYKDIRNIQSAANRAAGLVANLLGFSRKQTQRVSVLNLGEVATDLTPILRTSTGEKIELKIQSERDLWYVRADKSQIDNVLINLCVNARDAMPKGGKLTIRTRNVAERESQKMSGVVGFTPGEYVLIEVADTGTGMSADVMAKIFEPFFTTKGVGKGTGLGLASVYGIVKQSGGFIQPESEIGVGTTFKVYLPRYVLEDGDEVDAAPAKSKADNKPVDLTGTGRVLLVEDEIDVRQFAVRALKRQGYQVLEAGDGVEALEVMEANQGTVDIVISDVVMPEMDGPTLFKELRRRNPSIKVIFVSGYPNEAFRESLGTDDFAFLPKPFSLPQLAQKVKEELAK